MEMNLNQLTKEQRAELKAQLVAEEKAEAARVQLEREKYKEMVDSFVRSKIEKLQELSLLMQKVKREIFDDAQALIGLKNDMFNVKGDRRSDTFTTQDGRYSLTLGSRVNEGWDDTVNAGMDKVKEYLNSLAKDDNSAALVETVMGLMSKDRKGNLKASKVLELERLACKTQDPIFLEGISIIKDAYCPVPSCQFIEVSLRDENGNEMKLPLSLAAMK